VCVRGKVLASSGLWFILSAIFFLSVRVSLTLGRMIAVATTADNQAHKLPNTIGFLLTQKNELLLATYPRKLYSNLWGRGVVPYKAM
jgi:hypothetical protein